MLLEPDEPPKNLGWSAFEGTERIEGHELDRGRRARLARRRPTRTPRAARSPAASSTAAPRSPALGRRYVYGDFCSGTLWSLAGHAGGPRRPTSAASRRRCPQLTHIGTDADGELLFASGNGALYRAVPAGSGS